MSTKHQKLIIAWIKIHKDELIENWSLMREGDYFNQTIQKGAYTMNNIPMWVVTKVEPTPDYKLILNFSDGSTRIFDFNPLLDTKIFEPLKNPVLFSKAKIECGTVVWNDDLDISPEHLYENSTIIDSPNHTYNQFIYDFIQQRKSNNMTQHDLATACNLPQSAIARIENKSSSPQLNTLLKIIDILGCELKIIPKSSKKEQD